MALFLSSKFLDNGRVLLKVGSKIF